MGSNQQNFVTDKGYSEQRKRLHWGWITITCVSLVLTAICGANLLVLSRWIIPAPMHLPVTSTETTTAIMKQNWLVAVSMNNVRLEHTASILKDGKVLVAGGTADVTLNSTELYDPLTGNWTVMGNMNNKRRLHAAAVLDDGKVLVVGGIIDISSLNSSELYDPSTGNWTTTSSMNNPRVEHTVSPTWDGMLVVGGRYSSTIWNTAEWYDVGSGIWYYTGPMQSARTGHAAAALSYGNILVVGGSATDEKTYYLRTAEIYDSINRNWTYTRSMNYPRYGHTATSLTDGRVLVTGGLYYNDDDANRYLNPAELYDPLTETWTPAGSMSNARTKHTATLLSNGKVLVTGGLQTSSLDSVELYDPSTNNWTTIQSVNYPRYSHTASVLSDGKVLVTGGNNIYNSNGLDSVEIYDPSDKH